MNYRQSKRVFVKGNSCGLGWKRREGREGKRRNAKGNASDFSDGREASSDVSYWPAKPQAGGGNRLRFREGMDAINTFPRGLPIQLPQFATHCFYPSNDVRFRLNGACVSGSLSVHFTSQSDEWQRTRERELMKTNVKRTLTRAVVLHTVVAIYGSTLVSTAIAQDARLLGDDVTQVSMPVEGNLITSKPDLFTGVDVATLIGADRFYDNGYTGAGTITSNIEAGHVWNGHEALGHVTVRDGITPATWGTPAYDRHATWVGHVIGGRTSSTSPFPEQAGIAYGTDLRSGAIATAWNGAAFSGSFAISGGSLITAYTSSTIGFGTANVINGSWGAPAAAGSESAAGTDTATWLLDALANQNRLTTAVWATGNNGTASQVSAPASGFNGIAVGALANDNSNNYNTIASFSGRGAADYRDSSQFVPAATARRAAVDIVAPGNELTLAYYGGTTGGNDDSLGGTASGGPTTYSGNRAGTSFAAPMVAAAASLMHGAAIDEGLGIDARDTRVTKAVLMNSARKIPGWNNAQVAHPNGNGGVRTTQALDLNSGAGALDLNKTYDNYLSGQTDITGTIGGTTAEVLGWDYASVLLGGSADVIVSTAMEGLFNVTLTWFRERAYDGSSIYDIGFANLDLQVWDSTFTTLISESASLYTETEHLSFVLPDAGLYAIRVMYTGNTFGPLISEEFGLAWYGTAAVPEPGSVVLIGIAGFAMLMRRRNNAAA